MLLPWFRFQRFAVCCSLDVFFSFVDSHTNARACVCVFVCESAFFVDVAKKSALPKTRKQAKHREAKKNEAFV